MLVQKCFKLILTLLLTSFVLVGCGENNNQPVIERLPNQTLELGDTVEVTAHITDADFNEITVDATSNNTDVVKVSTGGTGSKSSTSEGTEVEKTLIIKAVGPGVATITISATDDSRQDNAEAIPVLFTVTVNKPPALPPSEVCRVGMIIKKGGSCTHPGTGERFSVDASGRGRFLFITAGTGISLRAANITFVASKRADGSWEIEDVGD